MSCGPRTGGEWRSRRSGRAIVTFIEKNVNGAGAEHRSSGDPAFDEWPEDWSEDGRYLAYGRNTTQGIGGLFALPLFGDRKPITIADTPFTEDEPRFSKTVDGWPTTRTNQG